jgi:N utilization substance protein B
MGGGRYIIMAKISRKEARDILFGLLFEVEFKQGENPTEIYNLSCANREIPGDDYIKNAFFGVITRADVIDAVISKYSKGWRSDRLSKVSRTVLRIAIYEILFVDDIHPNISISQAVELVVKYGEDKAKQFVNGVLSGVYSDWEKDGAQAIITEAADSKSTESDDNTEPSTECDEK